MIPRPRSGSGYIGARSPIIYEAYLHVASTSGVEDPCQEQAVVLNELVAVCNDATLVE